MKTQKQIEDRIKQIVSNDRYASNPKRCVKVQINAPLALEQVRMSAEVRALKWVLGSEK